jgi:hypothetical protein
MLTKARPDGRYLTRAERMISQKGSKRLTTYKRELADYPEARDYAEDDLEPVDIP